MEHIRRHINTEKSWDEYLKHEHYQSLCAALDVVGDIDEAIATYLNLEETTGRGINYVYIYGMVNALHSQTEAVRCIYKFFLEKPLNIRESQYLDIVRILRNKIFAHASDTENQKQINAFGIIASSLTTFSFVPNAFRKIYDNIDHDKLSLYEKVSLLGKGRFKGKNFTIDMREMIQNHQAALIHYLTEVTKKINTLNNMIE